ncbi:monovalent cation/H(+) antiporter subunit G [Candidatus Bipolaricaulota bacterium]|nr:monovalent cation/H(+) antiporter subunit G [Candidatus Bipolaricaulota bacterium]
MIGDVLLILGVALLLLGGLGMIRFRDPYDRLQAAGVADIGGATLFLVGLILRAGWGPGSGIMVLLILFLLFTGPLATHAIAKGAFVRGHRPKDR